LVTRPRISAARVVDESGNVLGLVSEHNPLAKFGNNASELMTTAPISISADCTMNDIRRRDAWPIKPCDPPHASAQLVAADEWSENVGTTPAASQAEAIVPCGGMADAPMLFV
jgi:hypothetical protein